MKISFNNFKKQYQENKKEYDNVLKRVLTSGWYILGNEVKSFEELFAKYIGVKYCVGVANGMEAIQIALSVLGIGKGDEVITTSHTAAATVLAIKSVGANPVFVDVDEYFCIDSKKIENKITKKTKAVIPVHIYGQIANISEISKICKKHKLQLIEDCAQSHGAMYKEKKAGSFGIVNCFSFYPTKNLGAFGDGGALTTNDESIYKKALELRNYGQKNRYEHDVIGMNSRLDEIQAAFLSVSLKYLDKNNKRRRKIAEMYFSHLKDVKYINLPKMRKDSEHVFHLFVIEAPDRDNLAPYLKAKGIDCLIHYPIPVHKQKCFKEFNKVSLPVLENKVKNILSLPINPFLSEKEVKYICQAIKSYYSK